MYGFKILCEISKVPFEIAHKILNTYTTKYAFYLVLKFCRIMMSWSYDILRLSETGPWHVLLPNGRRTVRTYKIRINKILCDISFIYRGFQFPCRWRQSKWPPVSWRNIAAVQVLNHILCSCNCTYKFRKRQTSLPVIPANMNVGLILLLCKCWRFLEVSLSTYQFNTI